MSIKIKVSYEEEHEANLIISLLKPVLHCFKVKKSEGTAPFKHLYFIPTNHEKARK